MDKIPEKGFQKGFGLIGLLIAMALMATMFYYLMKHYYLKPMLNRETSQELKASGIDARSYTTVTNSIRLMVDKMNKKAEQGMDFQ